MKAGKEKSTGEIYKEQKQKNTFWQCILYESEKIATKQEIFQRATAKWVKPEKN